MEQENKKEEKKSIAWGVSSLVTSIFSILLFFMPYFGLPLSIFAVVAHSKQKKIKPTGISMAGFVCGIVGIIINAIMLFFVGIAVLLMASTGGL